jgi:hypothetical protein
MELNELAKLVEEYNPATSSDNREDELDLHRSIVCATGIGGMNPPFEQTFLRSLNAAMSLVPEGWALRIKQATRYDQTCWTGDGRLAAWVVSLTPDDNRADSFMRYKRGEAATPALALTAATLRAIAETEEQQP